MHEYIEREAAKDELLSWAVCINHPGHLMREDAMHVLDSIPASDVAPVRHGKWLHIHQAVVDTTGDCSACDTEAVWRTRNKPYGICPNCGAKMDLEG